MNIFLPYEDDVIESVKTLDDLRLNKQILECYQLMCNSIRESRGQVVKGYKSHPIYLHFKDNLDFLCFYGGKCCIEYEYRFDKEHRLKEKFRIANIVYGLDRNPKYTPYYMEGSKGQPNYIRTITDVEILFQSKLISKWQNDKKEPKWSNRKIPIFYQNYLNLSENDKNKYWEYILNIKRKHYGKS